MSHPPPPHEFDVIQCRPRGSYRLVLPIDLKGLFDRIGVLIDDPRVPSKWPRRRRRRPCKAAWTLDRGRLHLAGLWGRLHHFRFDAEHDRGRAAWLGDLLESDQSRAVLRASGHTRFWQRCFPDLPPGREVFADWVCEEIVVLDGEQFADGSRTPVTRPIWSHFERNRCVTIEAGVVTRAWIRRNRPDDEFDPTDRQDDRDDETDRSQRRQNTKEDH